MKKLIFTKIAPILVSLILISFITLIWNKINLPFKNPNEIIGNYSSKQHHVFNDTFRYILFIGLSLFFYLFFYLLLNKNINKFNNLFIDYKYKNEPNNYNYKTYLFIFVLLTIFHALSIDFSHNKLDIFHEGQLLSGALNFDISKKLWTSTYSNTGIFYDLINTKIAWTISGIKSIGSMRAYNIFLNYFSQIILIFLIFNISKKFDFNYNQKIIFFVILSILSNYFFQNALINYRDILLLFYLIFTLNILSGSGKNYLSCFLLGLLSIFSLLWSLDSGAYLNVCLVPLIIILLYKKEYLKFFAVFFGIILGWFIFYSIVPALEFKAFLYNSISIYKEHELLNGIIHPQPFSNEKNSSRATKILMIILANGIILINIIFSKKNLIPNNTKLFLILFFILAFVNYKTGLSRSDGGHIEKGGSISLLLLIILITYYLCIFLNSVGLNKIKFFKKGKTSILIIILVLFINNNLNSKSINNIINFNSRLKDYVQLKDQKFLDKNYLALIKKISSFSNNERCFQSFTYEPTLSYLLKKRSCTKYYNIWSIGSKKNQLKFIDELQLSKAKYILYGSPYDSWGFSPQKRFPYINDFIKKNYNLKEEFLDWKILILKN